MLTVEVLLQLHHSTWSAGYRRQLSIRGFTVNNGGTVELNALLSKRL